jgi:uncharacterized protein (DUF1499 family)
METQSRVASWARRVGLAALVFYAAGPLAIQLGAASSFVGFRVHMLGILLALVALPLAIAGVLTTRIRSGRSEAVTGLVLGLAIVGTTIAVAAPSGPVPTINDITTDPDDPPVFSAAARIEANQGRDLGYPGEDFARQQRAGYPDLAPIRVARPAAAVFPEAKLAATSLGWAIVEEDPDAGRIEATDTTRLFRFVDDVVIRIRPDGAGAVVDVRSKSRDGKGDMGANAARIRAFRDAIAPPAD